MEKKVSEQYMFMNPHSLAFLKVMENSKNAGDVFAFPTKSMLSAQALKYPVVNIKCLT
jgi:hypothetical protein